MQEIDLATQTMFAELLQRSLDAEFDVSMIRSSPFNTATAPATALIF
jgi:hypothetical protein